MFSVCHTRGQDNKSSRLSKCETDNELTVKQTAYLHNLDSVKLHHTLDIPLCILAPVVMTLTTKKGTLGLCRLLCCVAPPLMMLTTQQCSSKQMKGTRIYNPSCGLQPRITSNLSFTDCLCTRTLKSAAYGAPDSG